VTPSATSRCETVLSDCSSSCRLSTTGSRCVIAVVAGQPHSVQVVPSSRNPFRPGKSKAYSFNCFRSGSRMVKLMTSAFSTRRMLAVIDSNRSRTSR